MADNKPSSISALCFTGILVTLGALYAFPQLTLRRSYVFPKQSASHLDRFPMQEKLDVIWAGEKSGLKGKRATLAELANENGIIVNLWATWCPPCLDEMPSLEVFARQLQKAGVKGLPAIVTLSVDERKDQVTTLFRSFEFSPSFVVLHDVEGKIARSVGTTKFPETYWVDKEGKIKVQWVGPQDWLEKNVVKVFAAN